MTYIRKKPVMKRRPYKRLYKRPTRKSARSSVVSIVKRQLAKAIEKKVADPVFSPIGQTIEFASTLGGNSAFVALDINPVIIQGAGGNERIGNRVGITSGHLQVQLNGMSNQFRAIPYKIMIIMRKNVSTSEAPTNTVKNFFVPNPFTGLIDSTSSQNVNMRSNYQIVGMRRGVLPPAQTVEITGGGGNQPAPGNRTVTMGFKFKKPMTQRYNEDNSTLSTRNDLILVFLAGNNSDAGASTGISSKFYFQSYYQDA